MMSLTRWQNVNISVRLDYCVQFFFYSFYKSRRYISADICIGIYEFDVNVDYDSYFIIIIICTYVVLHYCYCPLHSLQHNFTTLLASASYFCFSRRCITTTDRYYVHRQVQQSAATKLYFFKNIIIPLRLIEYIQNI